MEELRMALDLLLSEGLSEIIISNPRQKEGTVKVKIRPVLLKEQLMFQITRFRENRFSMKIMTENRQRKRLRLFWQRISDSLKGRTGEEGLLSS